MQSLDSNNIRGHAMMTMLMMVVVMMFMTMLMITIIAVIVVIIMVTTTMMMMMSRRRRKTVRMVMVMVMVVMMMLMLKTTFSSISARLKSTHNATFSHAFLYSSSRFLPAQHLQRAWSCSSGMRLERSALVGISTGCMGSRYFNTADSQ